MACCSEPGCFRRPRSRGMCHMHYQRSYRRGLLSREDRRQVYEPARPRSILYVPGSVTAFTQLMPAFLARTNHLAGRNRHDYSA